MASKDSFDGQAHACHGCLIPRCWGSCHRWQVTFSHPTGALRKGTAGSQHLHWDLCSGLSPASHTGAACGCLPGGHNMFTWRVFCLSPHNCPKKGFWRVPAPPEGTVADFSRQSWPLWAPGVAIREAGVPPVPQHRRAHTAAAQRGSLASCGVWVLWLGFGDHISQLSCTSAKEQELTQGK